ncbi:Membrane protein involved in the export of O-antigen and teichoic acid [Bryocella elongata]|uniref:Membrane protein involved in the export of O-antigen and teichoic acid n=1 Tax=Bryocella elongata TaxID=863522 RepID=A0A1H5WFK2_9BACT|nr:lipopolysaccharide biosynthesis protein [Bryocella elongata]SEF98244.1 Membrane protein involved in the export of O-antigen and teichoic acid [Bryocella elongata]
MTPLSEAGTAEEIEVSPVRPQGLLTRARKLVSERFGYALGDQIVFSLGNMAVAAFISRYCTPWEFGIYILTQRSIDLIQQLCSVFLWAPLMFNLPSLEKEKQRAYLGSIFVLQILALLFATLVLRGAAWWSTTPSRGMYYGVFAPLVVTAFGIIFREYTRRMYFAEIRMKEAFWTDVATNGLQVIAVCWLWRAHRLNVGTALSALSICAILVSFWWLINEWKTFDIEFSSVLPDLWKNLRLGKWFLGSNMVFTVSSQANPWLLGALMGGGGVGAYSICEQVVNIPRVALVSIQNIMAPMMARAYADGGRPALTKMVRRLDGILFGGAALFAAGVLLIGPQFAQLVYKHFPANGRMVLVVLALNLVVYASTMAQGYALTAIEHADFTFYAQLAGLVAQLAISVWLVHAFALPGAAGAMLIGSAVVLVVRQFFYTRELKAI